MSMHPVICTERLPNRESATRPPSEICLPNLLVLTDVSCTNALPPALLVVGMRMGLWYQSAPGFMQCVCN